MKYSFGLRFTGASTSRAGSYRSFTERDKRHIVRLRAKVRQPLKDLEVSAIVSDLSRTGCKLESLISLDPKAPLLINYKSYPAIRATIMWSKTGAHGCKFDRPIADNILLDIVSGA